MNSKHIQSANPAPDRRHCLWSAALLVSLWLASGSLAAALNPDEEGSGVQVFDILRGDKPIGTHTVRRTREGGLDIVESRTRISVRLLGFEIYRFDYDARESWDEHGLLNLTARVDDNGEVLELQGRRDDRRFVWSDGQSERAHDLPVFPTNHWNSEVLQQDTVLNTLTGRINRVTIHDEGMDTVALEGTGQPARRFRYDGQLQLESWYDPDGQWLAMRFTSDDGSTIDYRCRNCPARNGS